MGQRTLCAHVCALVVPCAAPRSVPSIPSSPAATSVAATEDVPPAQAPRMRPRGEWVADAVYPSVAESLRLGKENLHLFRLRNNRFDVIGGLLYYSLVVSS